MNARIELQHISKSFRSASPSIWPWKTGTLVQALDDVSFDIAPGELTALVGTNGAGKSTLLKILAALITPDQGSLHLDGQPFNDRSTSVRSRISWAAGDDRGFYARLTARQNLDFFGALYDLPSRDRSKRIESIAQQLHIDSVLDRPYQELSTGTRQRVALARAQLQKADILLMDEPTRSLDPMSRQELLASFREMAHQGGASIVMTTHDLHEAYGAADRIGFIHQGRFAWSGSDVSSVDILESRFKDFCLLPPPLRGRVGAGGRVPFDSSATRRVPPSQPSPSRGEGVQKLFAFAKRDWQLARTYRMNFIFEVLQTMTIFLSFFFIGKLVGHRADAPISNSYGGDYFRFVFLGIAFSAYMTAGLGALGDIIGFERSYGTLEAILVTPTSFPLIATARVLSEIVLVTGKVALYLFVGVFCFHADISHARWLPVLVTVGLTVSAFMGIGFFSAGIQLLMREGSPLESFIGWASRFFGGAYFPISVFPAWLTTVSAFLPLTYSLEAVRQALTAGASFHDIRGSLTGLFVLTFLFFPTGIIFFGWSFRRARQQGQLGLI